MEVLKEDFSDIEIGTSAESFQRFLDSQRDLFHSQIDQMQRLVVTQCNLTGVNPLSQEMAAGALSIKIGKRPRDLLNPKAVKYMQSVFSIKDAISKKESREISALFGVTVPQVRDFFVSQRSRVKRQIRLASEKSIRSNTCKESCDGVAPSSDPITSIDPVPLNTIGPPNVEDGPSCSTQDDIPPGIDDLDKQFVQEIFTLMRKEETFSGRVKLMERILRIQNLSVLCWFLMKGGVMILATWLSQAAAEEQTSFLQLILKVLCHLPLHKALPMHMSVILQSVNKLRFYRIQDVSNRARILLSRWSKLLARTQALTKPNGMKPLTETDAILKQSIGEIMHDESWQSNMDNLGGILSLSNRNLGNSRKLESSQMLKLLPSSSDDLNRKNMFGVSSSQIRERRKVQLVEQPGQRGADRSPPATRAATVSQSRPMSTDDIQKAKMRAQYMQSKYGKSSSSIGSMKANIQPSKKPLPTVSKVPDQSNTVEPEKPLILPSNNTSTVEVLPEPKMQVKPKESLQEKCKRIQIQWRSPPEIKLNDLWRVGDGENSKEVEGQKNRIRREKETFYQTLVEIPSNPKGPWDLEMDYDDSLTPEIPTEQLPDTDNCTIETQPEVTIHNQGGNNAVSSLPVSSQNVALGMAEPDLELLAVLLKNPELVFALTSGQADNLSSEDMVKLLDLIKAGGPGLMGGGASSNGLGSSKVEKVEVSLPSPTPSSNPGTRSAWKPQAVRNPFSQQRAMADGFSQHSTRLPPQIPSGILDPHTLISSLHQTSYTNTTIRYSPVINSPLASNTKPLSMASSSNNLQQERASASYFPTQNVQRQPELSSDSWRNATSYPNRAVENSYYSSVVAVGSQQPHLHQGGPSSEGNGKYMGDDVYESWSPGNNSSARASWNFLEHRMNPGRSNRLPDRERQWYGDESRYEDRR